MIVTIGCLDASEISLNVSSEVGFYERDRLDKLGTYFAYFNVKERYGITFEQFIRKVDSDDWSVMVRARQAMDRYEFK